MNDISLNNNGGNVNISNRAETAMDSTENFNIQHVANKLWHKLIPMSQTEELIQQYLTEMRDGYRLVFSVVVIKWKPYQGVVLVAKHDYRTNSLKIERRSGSTHIALTLLFKNNAEWQAQSDKLVAVWPEQPFIPLLEPKFISLK